MPEELFKIELTTSQLKCLKDALQMTRIEYNYKCYLSSEAKELAILIDYIDMQTIIGEQL